MRSLPRFRVMRQQGDEWVQQYHECGWPVRTTGLDPERSRWAAMDFADQFAQREPGAVFMVVDDAGDERYRPALTLACPF
jgi:hypothetical protein